jgi:hypothetical protein
VVLSALTCPEILLVAASSQARASVVQRYLRKLRQFCASRSGGISDRPLTEGSDLTPHCLRKMLAWSPKSTNVNADLNGLSLPSLGEKYTSNGLYNRTSFSVLTGMKGAECSLSMEEDIEWPILVERYCFPVRNHVVTKTEDYCLPRRFVSLGLYP